jgi:hypothetical protein
LLVYERDSLGCSPERITYAQGVLQDRLANRILPRREGFVMRDALDEQIEYFEAHINSIRQRGAGWVIVANQKHVKTFSAFPEAAKYAREHYGRQPVLIRHTDERAVETAPYIQVRSSR